MFHILVVEDNTDKLRHILQTIEQIPGVNPEHIHSVIDAYSAKKLLQEIQFDLLILDIAIPPRKSAEVDEEGGLRLLEEVLARDIYHMPTHIIGITAHEKIFHSASLQLAENALTTIHYKEDIDDWQRALRAGIEQRAAAKKAALQSRANFETEVVFICALRSECDALRSNGWDWSPLTVANDDSLYYQASFLRLDGRTGKAVAMVASRMGMPAAAAATMKLIMHFKPHYLFMTGIMAGVSGRVNLGDIIIANPVWDWGSGKWKNTSPDQAPESAAFEGDPFQFTLDTQLNRLAMLLSEDHEALYHIRKSFGKNAPNHDLNLHVGAVASGASVLADRSSFEKVKEQHRKLLGIEMEAYGLFTAVFEAPRPRPSCMCIKSVVDFGDLHKSDDYQPYGSFVSAKAAQWLIEKYLTF